MNSNSVSLPEPSPLLELPIQALALFGRTPPLASLTNDTAAAAVLAAVCTNAVVAICVVLLKAAAVGAVGVPANAGEIASTSAPAPVAVFVLVPPCPIDKGVVRPASEVISKFAPLPAAPKLLRAVEAELAAVPPFAMATIPVTLVALPDVFTLMIAGSESVTAPLLALTLT